MNSFDKEFAKIQEEYHSFPESNPFEIISGRDIRVVIFGAGSIGNAVAENTELKGKLVAFCDNYKSGYNDRFHLPIISPAQLACDYEDCVVIVAVTHRFNDEIYNQVIAMGFPKTNVFRFYSELYNMDRMKRHYDGYKWAYEFFKEDISRKIVLNRIRRYLFDYEMDHSPYEEQYFEQDVIRFTDREVFVDGGCSTGDTALEFIKRMDGRYAYIYGFEPEEANFEKAKNDLAKYRNIELIKKGLWDKDDVMSFVSDRGASKIDGNGGESIFVTSLDNFFADKTKEEMPTFIKLDIEGSEKRALIGAGGIITKIHPKLAVCVYHRAEDIYELPRLISNFGSYQFKLRHYTKGNWETVLYAV